MVLGCFILIHLSYFFKACDNATFGVQCSEVCNCLMENTFDCNDITGKCACKGNWNGGRCEIHVEDCINGSAVCDLRKEKCAKENGTDNHFCVCLYGKTPTNKTCLGELRLNNVYKKSCILSTLMIIIFHYINILFSVLAPVPPHIPSK